VDNTRDYARVSHSRQWSNNNVTNTNSYYFLEVNTKYLMGV